MTLHAPVSSLVATVHQMISPHIRRTPLVRTAGGGDVHLKCENLQLTGSFKLRGALSGLLGYRRFHPDVWSRMRAHGVVTCSSGNFAQALAYATARLSLDYTVIVPERIAPAKMAGIITHNPRTRIVRVPYETWRHTMVNGEHPDFAGFFLSCETDDFVTQGNGTIGLEISEDLPSVDAVLVPYGGGNLTYSLATLFAGQGVGVYAVEITTGAPLSASLEAGRPVEVEYRSSFVDGIGASFVLPQQFHRVKDVIAGVLTVTPQEVAEALGSLLLDDKMLAEGAGAAALAAARKYSGACHWTSPCAVVSGATIDLPNLLGVLSDASQEEPNHAHR
ncbi:pyridoxal-phosphate dependent enzyme [Actinomadura graeca]|uniref:Pyridoxal-phosphate dependent enzyme n=1 Tax=Actinomadura graeca TaxID=2750812 RepID=A0ABX8QWT8_9ACTN|nr:pyridoxal-phosphate dependent enzyme [Actinomadura graeca]QXJ21233.1 pyridoxal-phosphate dependent enzyme [Actinomadura graeca]